MSSGVYAQMPIEAISPERYESIISTLLTQPTSHSPKLAPISDSNGKKLKVGFHDIPSEDKSDPDIERYCDSNICVLDPV